MTPILRIISILLVCTAILMPRVNAALIAALPGAFQTIIICTGTSLTTIVLDASGAPVSEKITENAPCIFAHGALLPEQNTEFWQKLSLSYTRVASFFEAPTLHDKGLLYRPPARAPPFNVV
ncbi:hypothetical protein [Cochlodiniinecator piscidefendens]|uniref:hypothetical protein n=1 Tax=Cochlodiniinecator piscidefendens TaxID=2715756 RepID=UPI001407AA06|nr:hypothetical protein [Cochlodiniinecator piscidefendens]